MGDRRAAIRSLYGVAKEGPIEIDRPLLPSSSKGKTDSEVASPGVRALLAEISSNGERRPARKSGLCALGESLALRAASNMKSNGDGSLALDGDTSERAGNRLSVSTSARPSPSS